jgi:hypothetical protein
MFEGRSTKRLLLSPLAPHFNTNSLSRRKRRHKEKFCFAALFSVARLTRELVLCYLEHNVWGVGLSTSREMKHEKKAESQPAHKFA